VSTEVPSECNHVTDAKLINWIYWISETSRNVKTHWRWFTLCGIIGELYLTSAMPTS